MLSACLAAMARGSDCRPLRKEPTVWPAGLGGSRATRGGGGLARFAWICLMTPAMMLPPAFSSAYTWSRQEWQRLSTVAHAGPRPRCRRAALVHDCREPSRLAKQSTSPAPGVDAHHLAAWQDIWHVPMLHLRKL